MALFVESGGLLKPIQEKKIDLERDIQKLTEENLNEVFGYDFVSSEFPLNGLRIDTLAFDRENKSFIVIEYKKVRNLSVIDQGYSYLALLLNNKSDFILEYNEKGGNSLKRDDIDWSQSRVIFVSPQFTTYQKGAIEFKDLPIELWEVKLYDNDLVLYSQLQAAQTSESIRVVSKDKTIAAVSREVKEYTINDHLDGTSLEIKELFEYLQNKILSLDESIKVEYKKLYIAYKLKSNFVDIVVSSGKNSRLWVYLNIPSGKLDDPHKMARDLRNPRQIGHWGDGDYEVSINSKEDIDKLFELIKQSYEYQKNK
jgi:predicted transport protein